MEKFIFKHNENGQDVYYEKHGICRHCGECCSLSCAQFTWEVLRDIQKDEIIESGIDKGAIRSRCNIFYDDIYIEKGCNPEVRANYPSSPFSTLPGCGFYWIKVEGS